MQTPAPETTIEGNSSISTLDESTDRAKIQIRIGQLELIAEGAPRWIAAQVTEFYRQAPLISATPSRAELPQTADPQGTSGGRPPMLADPEVAKKPLATFLQEKAATTNQVKKFLATAIWLESRGARRMKTTDVVKALSEANQSRLGNATECLNRNVSKGHCEKETGQFYVTEEGKTALSKL